MAKLEPPDYWQAFSPKVRKFIHLSLALSFWRSPTTSGKETETYMDLSWLMSQVDNEVAQAKIQGILSEGKTSIRFSLRTSRRLELETPVSPNNGENAHSSMFNTGSESVSGCLFASPTRRDKGLHQYPIPIFRDPFLTLVSGVLL